MKTKTTIISLLTASILAAGLFLLVIKQIPKTKEVINTDSTVIAICPAKVPVEEKPLICTPPPVPHPAQAETQTLKKTKAQVEVLSIVEDAAPIIAEEEIVCCEALVTTSSSDYYDQEINRNEYNQLAENKFRKVKNEPLSTFSIDVDAASYGTIRRYINEGQNPPADAVRVEELINYFSYSYEQPVGKDPVKITTEIGSCPWNKENQLVRIGLKAKEIPSENLPASNLVFLVDVSGSMYGPDRLGLVKSSLKLLINNLREEDRVAIVVYAGEAGVVLPSTSGSNKQKIREALDELTAGGSTAGGAGIQLAYDIARKNYIREGNNRVILCTDGDFNVGVSSSEGLERLVEKERKSGVFLTVLGYGMGNYKDNKMQVLAEKGNGNHAYIDNIQEANKTLVHEFGGTMYAVAKDVKLQIVFNPEQVQEYRLVGYESRLLNNKDFNDDTKDAGEMGAGHTVTAFYEIKPNNAPHTMQFAEPELLTIRLRYKAPYSDVSQLIENKLKANSSNKLSPDFYFASAVAMFGQMLRNSEYKGTGSYNQVISLAQSGLVNDRQGYKREFIRLVETINGLTAATNVYAH
ncbi:VWA domain-containing protein [Parabacteroides faecis]|uniref:vWA domain-containing protein n=1 Tax=Parabacteroides TaxID=375288 RepID=UPI000F00F439|nr:MULTISPECIES: VWA domain-containing protein [Parabacteroides]MBC8616207.1 VWA domain-containing protein [Parabacteroides faecis]RHR98418.1 VWA domain-containing protein [Parabacteroides sp. AF14-59]